MAHKSICMSEVRINALTEKDSGIDTPSSNGTVCQEVDRANVDTSDNGYASSKTDHSNGMVNGDVGISVVVNPPFEEEEL